MSEETKILIRLPKSMKQDLQIIAVKKETNMTSIILELIEQYINNNK